MRPSWHRRSVWRAAHGALGLGLPMLLLSCAPEAGAPAAAPTTAAPAPTQRAAARLADDPAAVATTSALQQRLNANANRLAPADLAILRQLYATYPAEPALLVALNNVLATREDWEGLRELYANRANLNPDQQLTLGKVHVRLGEWQQAADRLLPLAQASPDDAELAYFTARALRHLGRREEAAARLDAVVESLRRMRHVDALAIRGLLHLEADEPAAARDLFQEAIALDPGATAAHEGLGRALVALGEREQAASVLATVDALHQAEADAKGRQMRLSAGAEALKRAFRAGDMAEAERMVEVMLAEAEERALRGTLHEYAAQIYAATAREPEAQNARATATALAEGNGVSP